MGQFGSCSSQTVEHSVFFNSRRGIYQKSKSRQKSNLEPPSVLFKDLDYYRNNIVFVVLTNTPTIFN